ncbi:unnamed protein product [Hyaloperonospora brassicae]|uniref:Uncharacterized protein n=1 Tax=Hyaloperonospora brassicae TaxID=162125 RepID=A0AAV0T087_HYABA|nr:unnamed protein product [Hyaloperonospora brassicae]
MHVVKQLLFYVAQRPLALAPLVLVLSVFYGFARVLTLQYVVGALQDAASRRWSTPIPRTFVSAVCVAAVSAVVCTGLGHETVLWRGMSTPYWTHVLWLPLTLHRGKWSRLVGAPLLAFAVAVIEAVLVQLEHGVGGELVAPLSSWSVLSVPMLSGPERGAPRANADSVHSIDQAGGAWNERAASTAAADRDRVGTLVYARMAGDLVLAAVVCAGFALARFFHEPQYDGDKLREAASHCDILGVKLLLARGMNPDACSNDGTTALHVCAQQAVDRVARVLLDHGANANISDRLGLTPLHWAVQVRREEVSTTSRLTTIRLLLRHGANPHKPDASGTSSLCLASRDENQASLDVLNEFLPAEDAVGEADTTEAIGEAES